MGGKNPMKSVFRGVTDTFGLTQKHQRSNKPPAVYKPKSPTILNTQQLAKQRASLSATGINTPSGLRTPEGMTDLQKRTYLASMGTQGNEGGLNTPEIAGYLADLGLMSMFDANGGLSAPTDIERQFAEQALGEPVGETPEEYLSALLRAAKRI